MFVKKSTKKSSPAKVLALSGILLVAGVSNAHAFSLGDGLSYSPGDSFEQVKEDAANVSKAAMAVGGMTFAVRKIMKVFNL